MRDFRLLRPLALLVVFCVGCDQKGRFAIPGSGGNLVITPPVARPAASNGGPILTEDATGVWNRDQVEQYVTENLKLGSISLESAGGGDYRGTGVGQDGANYSFEAKQVPGSIDVQWSNDRGSSGGMSFLKSVR